MAASLACRGGEPGMDVSWLKSSSPLVTLKAMDQSGQEVIHLAGSDGRLEFWTDCIVLRSPDGRLYTAAWSEGRVAMASDSNTIVFLDPSPGPEPELLILDDGMFLVVGGYSRSSEDRPIYDFARPPHPSCPWDIWHIQTVAESDR
jgi:hypothetical protein